MCIRDSVNFTGEDVLGFCMTQSGTNTAGTWHIRFEGQSEGLQKNNNLGLSASDDAATLYFTVKSNFTGDGGLVRPSQPVSYTHLRAHETVLDLVCRLLLEKKKASQTNHNHT